jgi:DNA (cytosine-5)-methyltransferase 1
MLHLGDITKIRGYEAPVVDCVIGGSPCQDLSVAGKRAGLDGERSGLFMDQIRIVKEMREYDARTRGGSNEHIRPRHMVWENVPGAASSNKGDDFRIVLEEIAKVADKDAAIPMPDKGKWATSGCIVGEGWSIAWRILDAQFWGVPQRRRRIALVADFGGHSAPEILFVRKSLSGDFEQSQPKRQEAASDAARSVGADDRTIPYTLKIRSGCEGGGKGALIQEDKSATLSTLQDQTLFQPVYSVENHPNDSRVGINEDGKVQALTSRMGTGGGNVPMVMQQCYSKQKRAQSATDNETWVESDTSNTLNAFDVGDVGTTEAVVYALDRASFNQGENARYDFEVSDKGVNSPLVARGPGAVAYCIGNGQAHDAMQPEGVEKDVVVQPMVCSNRYIVRRLTPLECERLQGFPDGWTDIGEWIDSNGKRKQSSDAARYKALGNSIAIPPWKWVLKRLCACYERDATMASLFDGIGGFPLIWEQLNGKGSCLWASEIEEFPMAVTKRRFNE